MGNPDQDIESSSPEDDASQLTTRAADYYDGDVAADHVGRSVTKIVTDEDGNETRFASQYT